MSSPAGFPVTLGTEFGGASHRVAGGLELQHLLGGVGLGPRGGAVGGPERGRDVEVLAEQYLAAHCCEHRGGAANGLRGKAGVLEHLRAPGEQDIAQQDRGGLPETGGPGAREESLETAVGRWRAAPGVGAVQQVVVNQQGGVQQVEGGGGAQQRARVDGPSGGRDIPPVAEGGTQPFPTRDAGVGGVQHRRRARSVRETGLLVEELRECPPYRRDENRTHRVVGGGNQHAPQLRGRVNQAPGTT